MNMTARINQIELDELKEAFLEAIDIYTNLYDDVSLTKLKEAETAYLDYLETHD